MTMVESPVERSVLMLAFLQYFIYSRKYKGSPRQEMEKSFEEQITSFDEMFAAAPEQTEKFIYQQMGEHITILATNLLSSKV